MFSGMFIRKASGTAAGKASALCKKRPKALTAQRGREHTLRSRLLTYFALFSVALLSILWIMQIVLFGQYYQSSMKKKCKAGIDAVSSAYQQENLDYDNFVDYVGYIASENDIYFYIQATDGSYDISSSDFSRPGVTFPKVSSLFSDAKNMLLNSASQDEVIFTTPDISGGSIIICAQRVQCSFRSSVYIFAAATLTPIGPAVDIMRSQLLIVTIAALVLGVIIAFFTSKHLASPLVRMSAAAKRLGEGDFEVRFDGGDYEEINELADTLNDSAAKLKASGNLQKDLMANVSHDLRTPLTMIKSYAEMIRDISGENPEKRTEHLSVIIDETDRLSRLVNDILELSRVQAGTEKFEEKNFDLSRTAEEIVQTYKIMESEGFEIDFEPADGGAFVSGDEHKIKQVISNLMSNAVKYSDKEKKVRLYFIVKDESVRLCVEDRGIGIPEDQQKLIWDRYQRASQRSARSKDGSGLGLSICSEILKRHSADYGVESTLGKGSNFWFEMKTVSGPALARSGSEASPAKIPSQSASLTKSRK